MNTLFPDRETEIETMEKEIEKHLYKKVMISIEIEEVK